jgi:hypothetical protein
MRQVQPSSVVGAFLTGADVRLADSPAKENNNAPPYDKLHRTFESHHVRHLRRRLVKYILDDFRCFTWALYGLPAPRATAGAVKRKRRFCKQGSGI